MHRFLLTLLGVLASNAQAIVIRHDVPDAQYKIAESVMPALVSLPHEGHGVLISPQWILTAAHATQWHAVQEVMLGGRCLKVERLVVHPGYKKLPDELTKGNAAPAMAFLAQSDDVALIKLAEPVLDIAPVPLYSGGDEAGKLIKIIGMGATGDGKEGQLPHGPHRTQLRQATNVIDSVEARWLGYRFDAAGKATALEGMSGNGDSGGPGLIEDKGQWKLAGLTSWTLATGHVSEWKPGHYGSNIRMVRVSRYVPWITEVLSPEKR
jgi:hypothetical protein